MMYSGSSRKLLAGRRARGLASPDLSCLDAVRRVLSRQHVLGDRGMALDGSRSDNPLSDEPVKKSVRSQDGHSGGGRRRALVADEDPMMLWLLQRALANDFEVTVAQDGQRAVELAAGSCPDVIVLDLSMPVMDGFGACRLIRAAHPAV